MRDSGGSRLHLVLRWLVEMEVVGKRLEEEPKRHQALVSWVWGLLADRVRTPNLIMDVNAVYDPRVSHSILSMLASDRVQCKLPEALRNAFKRMSPLEMAMARGAMLAVLRGPLPTLR